MSSYSPSDGDGNDCHARRTVLHNGSCLECQENSEENKSSGIIYTQGEWEEGVAPRDITPSQGEKSENDGDASVFIKKIVKLISSFKKRICYPSSVNHHSGMRLPWIR